MISSLDNTPNQPSKFNHAYDIDVVIPMYDSIEYSDNYSKNSGILWQYCRDESAINAANGNIVDFNANNATIDSFKMKIKIADKTGDNS